MLSHLIFTSNKKGKVMKKLMLFIGVFIAAIVFNSCSSNDDNDLQANDKIVGKWRLSELYIDNIDQQVNECEKKMTIEVFDNGTYIEKDYEYNDLLTECMLYDQVNGTWENLGNSTYKMSGLDTKSVKVTFDGNTFIAEYTEIIEGFTFSIKTIFMAAEDVLPDSIIGNWKLVQEFNNGEEVTLSDCDLMGTFEFLEDGFFYEKEYEENETSTACIESPVKTRLWINIGNSTYKLYKIADDSVEEVKITFGTNTMTVEVTLEEEGVVYNAKLVFNKVT